MGNTNFWATPNSFGAMNVHSNKSEPGPCNPEEASCGARKPRCYTARTIGRNELEACLLSRLALSMATRPTPTLPPACFSASSASAAAFLSESTSPPSSPSTPHATESLCGVSILDNIRHRADSSDSIVASSSPMRLMRCRGHACCRQCHRKSHKRAAAPNTPGEGNSITEKGVRGAGGTAAERERGGGGR